MKRPRRTISSGFKSQVALEAIKEMKTSLLQKILFWGFLIFFCESSIAQEDIKKQGSYKSSLFKDKFIAGLQMDYIPHQFDEFENILGPDAIYQLNLPTGRANIELAKVFNGLFVGFNYGLAWDTYVLEDQKMKKWESNYMMKLGIDYHLKWLQIMPSIAFSYYNIHLKSNSASNENNSDYIVYTDEVKLNIGQFYFYQGLRIGLQIPVKDSGWGDVFTVGIYCNYMAKLNSDNIINMNNERLNSTQNIINDHVNMGIYFALTNLY